MTQKHQMSSADFRRMDKKPSKYRNEKVKVNGLVFDSQKEYRRYLQLGMMQKTGIISDLERQVSYTLVDTIWQPVIGKKGQPLKRQKCVQKSITYVADFRYKDENGNTVVEDVKGMLTEVYRIKKKLLRSLFGIEIKEV